MTDVTRSLFKYKNYGGGICISIVSGQYIKKNLKIRVVERSRVNSEANDTCRLSAVSIYILYLVWVEGLHSAFRKCDQPQVYWCWQHRDDSDWSWHHSQGYWSHEYESCSSLLQYEGSRDHPRCRLGPLFSGNQTMMDIRGQTWTALFHRALEEKISKLINRLKEAISQWILMCSFVVSILIK